MSYQSANRNSQYVFVIHEQRLLSTCCACCVNKHHLRRALLLLNTMILSQVCKVVRVMPRFAGARGCRLTGVFLRTVVFCACHVRGGLALARERQSPLVSA